MSLYSQAPLIISALILSVLLILWLVFSTQARKLKNEEKKFLAQLEKASGIYGDELSINLEKKETIFDKWNDYWGYKLKYSNLIENKYSNSQVGQLVAFTILIIYAVMSLIFRNMGIGIVPVLTGLAVVSYIANERIKKKEQIFEDQIPGFLATLKANIQANETPERALIDAINNTTDPLYSELKIAKSLTETGTFKIALTTLRQQTNNKTLKFLCSCIELSASVGNNLEQQITIIEEMLESNRALKRKLEIAISENKPLVIVTGALLPSLFIFMYLMNQQTRDFWFNSLLSWIVFGAVIFIFSLGIFLTNKIISKTAEF